MTSEALQKARDFEAQYGPHIPAGERFFYKEGRPCAAPLRFLCALAGYSAVE